MLHASTLSLADETEGISQVKFSPDGRCLLVTSWDGGSTVFSSPDHSTRYSHAGAVLCGSFDASSRRVYSGGLDCAVRQFQVGSEEAGRLLGHHQAGVRCCSWIDATNCLVSGSWDRTLKVWDPRVQIAEVVCMDLPDKVFAMDVCDNSVVVGLADASVNVFDVRSVDSGAFLSRPCTLGHQIRSMKLFEEGAAVYIGSIEGRVVVENLDVSAPTVKRYAFKCHRLQDAIFPVNAIAVCRAGSQDKSLFATGGGDGNVIVWDGQLKKKVHAFDTLQTSCSSLDFAADGSHLAIAASYTFERGDLARIPKDQVTILPTDQLVHATHE